ncbi:G-protein coupled receptor 135 [Gopherus flavomarginatus]|uniref:G-protein coupled receptor 135 n=1 Tax=Gopherus flavomarginatus TaxID=286002 RepID=UPI0021CC36CE|nr:G-protein coupled receptor 135 [Gopherus flavomarginatus]
MEPPSASPGLLSALSRAGGNESGGEAPTADPAAGAEEAGWSGAALASQALLLVLIFALSALGNGAVVLVIARHRQLRTVTNAFVLSLSLSELLGALLCLPLAFLRLLSRPRGAWLSGQRLCLASAALHAGLGIAATLTMALLSFDRYCAIVRQPRRKMGRRRAAALLAAVWLAALGFAAPWYLLAQAAGRGHGAGSGRCTYVLLPWGSSRLGPPYSAALIVLCYLLPFALMCFCHYNICRAVRLSESRVRPLTTYGHLLRCYGEMRTATTVLIMIVSIICCWGPYCVLGLAAAAGHLPFSPTVDAVASWMAWANGAINPLIYAARNPNIAMLLGRSREGGYRTRNNVAAYLAARGQCLEAHGRAEPGQERYAQQRPWGHAASALSSSSPASGGEVAMWACKNPAVLFCRDAQPDTASQAALPPKSDTADTSL